jgi:hypothetical protein
MTPWTRLSALGFSTLLMLPLSSTASDEEIASPEELAQLAARQHAFQVQLDADLHSRVDALIEDKVGRGLADRTTRLLRSRSRTRQAGGQESGAPAAIQSHGGDRPANPSEPPANTTCAMVGNTYECVLHEVASR